MRGGSYTARAATAPPVLQPPELGDSAWRVVKEKNGVTVRRADSSLPRIPWSLTEGEIATFSAAPNRIIPPLSKFRQHGQSGRWMSDLLPQLATDRKSVV